MPRLADTLVEGTVARWLKAVGDAVAAGEPLAAIETDKVTTELTSPAAGAVLELLVAEGATVPVETPIARVGAPRAAPTVTPVTPTVTPVTSVTPTVTPSVAKATPVAARLLAEHGLAAADLGAPDLGERGRVTKADVLRYLERTTAPPENVPAVMPARGPLQTGDVLPLSSMRKAIAEHMVRARHTIPHGQTVMHADLTALATWRDQHKSSFEQREKAPLTFTVCFVSALARALAIRQQPVDLGVAVALEAGLIVPVIRAADTLDLGATARAVADLASRARSGKLLPAETQGALMTVTNVGSFGNLVASPIVPLNQIGILGPGLVERRPLPTADGGIRNGWRCWLTLMFDRRAFDDLAADRFLGSVIEALQAIGY
jgi:pyruvate/2-oxoglutarate dehydrogenase complex dihydrolipoamide acyltransferase (E2) component